jgi:hypothetical protein
VRLEQTPTDPRLSTTVLVFMLFRWKQNSPVGCRVYRRWVRGTDKTPARLLQTPHERLRASAAIFGSRSCSATSLTHHSAVNPHWLLLASQSIWLPVCLFICPKQIRFPTYIQIQTMRSSPYSPNADYRLLYTIWTHRTTLIKTATQAEVKLSL